MFSIFFKAGIRLHQITVQPHGIKLPDVEGLWLMNLADFPLVQHSNFSLKEVNLTAVSQEYFIAISTMKMAEFHIRPKPIRKTVPALTVRASPLYLLLPGSTPDYMVQTERNVKTQFNIYMFF